ncbi:MAG: hypothetical protein ACUVWJ_10315 [Spirochaetota bacterium]
MRNVRISVFLPFLLLIFLFNVPLGFSQVGMNVSGGIGRPYHRFLVADLGLIGTGGKANSIFSVSFGEDQTNNAEYFLEIEVTDDISGDVLLSGETDKKEYKTYFSGKTYNNYNITDAKNLGGSFRISESSKTLQDKILATGAIPAGSFTITMKLMKEDRTPVDMDSINIIVTPPYLQPVYPVNVSTTKDALNFRWASNINNMELHIFTDPRGNNEILRGSLLPARGLGYAQSADGSLITPLLEDGKRYYWQIWGYIDTSHGTELVKGPLSEFLYFVESADVVYLGLSEEDKAAIMDEVLEILKSFVNKRAARSLSGYSVDRVVVDNSPMNHEEIMTILMLIKEKELKLNSIYFK